jgi:teichuronic acid biosynthesis glycosyltransferase TuaH
MGLDRGLVQQTLECNLKAAQSTMAVSPALASRLDALLPSTVQKTAVLPNGCELPVPGEEPGTKASEAVLVGQLNERLDLPVLEALQASGIHLTVIGPRTERDPETRTRLDAFLAADNVSWLGKLPYADTQAHLRSARVGLTPYRDTPFNRAAFPLKTLDYLASGLPVVATDLPSVRWLDTDLVSISSGPSHFVEQVHRILRSDPRGFSPGKYRAFAARHTWDERAAQLIRSFEGTGEHGNQSN